MTCLFYRRTITALAATLLASSILAGCGSTVRDTYDLTINDAAVSSQGPKQKRLQILIADPEAVRVLDGQDIVIRQDGSSISYLKHAQWSDRLPNLVQARLVQAFENSGRVAGVGRPGEGLAIDYQILTDIRAFDVVVSGERRVARVEITVKLMNDRSGAVRATRVFAARTKINSSVDDRYADALDAAFKVVVSDIVSWTLSKI